MAIRAPTVLYNPARQKQQTPLYGNTYGALLYESKDKGFNLTAQFLGLFRLSGRPGYKQPVKIAVAVKLKRYFSAAAVGVLQPEKHAVVRFHIHRFVFIRNAKLHSYLF